MLSSIPNPKSSISSPSPLHTFFSLNILPLGPISVHGYKAIHWSMGILPGAK